MLVGLFLLHAMPAHADTLARPEHCLKFYQDNDDQQWEVTENVSFSGGALEQGNWIVSKDTITVQFPEITITYNTNTVEYVVALMDWVGTALTNEQMNGFKTYASRNRETGTVWLMNQNMDSNHELVCRGHPLRLRNENS